ncbi:hypothetical protein GPECTOR_2g1176 [Gonium pectorale]|uniref:Peroxisomal ATPase PEX1 n=1 Tax=Gonium pectorale TaxID=33097 RepID=A0A150H0C7_GONPE|nr:hypothetical protein GPECTOR_2g1176 [Gonium pectorale]|eukprot:KXZ55626.1 hypothetical protein GPECTOR_2g1176 [Gonium pectorale]
MEFIESHGPRRGSHRHERFTIILTSQRNNWVSVPNPLAASLFDYGVIPVVLQLRVLDAAGYPSKQPGHTLHVAWCGDVQPGSGTLGLPSALASVLGLRAGATVALKPVLDVPEATVLTVEPETEDDWEVVEANAGFLEEQVLPQVRVLARGQVFPVWARGGAQVRLRVVSTQPADLVRLVPGCELHVAPRPRILPGGGGGGAGAGAGAGQGLQKGLRQQQQATAVPLTGPPPDQSSYANGWSLRLHTLPVPALRFVDALEAAPAAGAARGEAKAAAPSTLDADEGGARCQAAAAAAVAAATGAAEGPQALPSALRSWLSAQEEGIRRALHGSGASAEPDEGSGRSCGFGEGASDPEVLLPLASGAVVHFRLQARDGSTAATGRGDDGAAAALLAAPPPGDYCLMLHVVRRAHAGSGQPALLSSSMLAGLLDGEAPLLSLGKPGSRATQPGSQHKQPLAVKLGTPVVLPDVSYPAARTAAASLAARPLPLPLPLAALLPVRPQSQGPSEPVGTVRAPPTGALAAATTAPASSARTAAAAPASSAGPEAMAAAGPLALPHLDLDLQHISWLGEQLEGCLRRLLPQIDPWVSAAVARAGLPRCGGVLVTGPPGSGRSPLLSALGDAAERHPWLQAHVLHVRCAQLAGGTPGAATSALASVAAEALSCAPSLILLDDLDLLCPSAADGPEYGMQHPDGAAAAARLADWLSALLDELAEAAAAAAAPGASPPPAVAVVASSRDAAAVHAALRRVGRLDYEVRLPTPGCRGRAAMLASAARQRGVDVEAAQLAAVAGAAEGFEGVDLRLLLDRAVHEALRRQLRQQQQQVLCPPGDDDGRPTPASGAAGGSSPTPPQAGPVAPASAPLQLRLSVTEGDLRSALEGFVPAAFWGVQQAAEAGGRAEGWEDVGGLADVMSSLREALLLPIKYRQLVAAAPLRLRTGALLYGPPGCGKTHVVGAAVAAVSKIAPVRFLAVKGPELLNKYIGASEAAVRDLFARAAAAAPAVLFFDEFDAIAPPRGHDSTGVTDRVVNQLLTELDGVEGLRGVVVLAATSRPDLIDAALLRPGRLDRLLFCGPPDSAQQRLQILRAVSRRLNLDADVDLEHVAARSDGMTAPPQRTDAGETGASVGASSQSGPAPPASGPVIRMRHVLRALAAARPSLPSAEAARLAALYARFRSDREAPAGRAGASGAGPEERQGMRATLA